MRMRRVWMIRCAGWHHVSDHHGLHDDLPDHLWRPGHRNMAAALVKVGTIAVDATVRAAPLVPLLAALRFSCGLGGPHFAGQRPGPPLDFQGLLQLRHAVL